MPITTDVASSNPVHGELYSIQYYVMKFVSDLRQVGRWFSPVPSTTKTDRHDIIEILLKGSLNTITLTYVLTIKTIYWSEQVIERNEIGQMYNCIRTCTNEVAQ
jgi:hypothetical protein